MTAEPSDGAETMEPFMTASLQTALLEMYPLPSTTEEVQFIAMAATSQFPIQVLRTVLPIMVVQSFAQAGNVPF